MGRGRVADDDVTAEAEQRKHHPAGSPPARHGLRPRGRTEIAAAERNNHHLIYKTQHSTLNTI